MYSYQLDFTKCFIIYLRVSCRLFPRDREMDLKKPWTAGTVYIKRVLDKSFWNENCWISSMQAHQPHMNPKLKKGKEEEICGNPLDLML